MIIMSENQEIIKLELNNIKALIVNGQLSGLKFNNKEIIHTAGQDLTVINPPDWTYSEINMFPIVGETNSTYQVLNNDSKFLLDRHGVSRLIPFYLAESTSTTAKFVQDYKGELIENPKKYIEGHPEFISWIPFKLSKTIQLIKDGVQVSFVIENTSQEIMNYQFGWHPAFRINGDIDGGIITDDFETKDKDYVLTSVVQASLESISALHIRDSNKLSYKNQSGGFEIKTEGFSNFMIWCPGYDASMFCIEPVTHLPVPENERNYFKDKTQCNVLMPGESKNYFIKITFVKS